jgi:outer membrane protein
MLKRITNILLLLTLFYSYSSMAIKFSWEFGAGFGVFDIPLYPGSSQNKQYLFPLPYIKLESKHLEIDEGIRAFLFRSDKVRLDLSADLALPVRSKDSIARSGMPSLDTVLQIGPSLEITLAGKYKSKNELRLEFPVRTAIATDIKDTRNIGWLVESVLTYERKRQHKKAEAIKVRLGLRYATEDYHEYYYDVAPAYISPQRAVFTSGGGYSGLFTDIGYGWREGNTIYWTLLRYQSLSGAVYENSPLVEDKDYFLLGAGFSWIFAQSL